MSNPLLGNPALPSFSQIENHHIEPAIDELLAQCRAARKAVVDAEGSVTWLSLVEELELLDDSLNNAWSPVSHLNAVCNNDELRDIYTRCIAKLSEYGTEVGQNAELYEKYVALSESDEYGALTTAQKRTIDLALRDFRLAGVALPEAEKQRYKAIQSRLSELSNQFSNNVLDSTMAWEKHFDSADALAGLPDSALAMARQSAESKEQQGYRITLDIPSYLSVMTYADDRALREEMYTAYCTRASDQGPFAGERDNTPLGNVPLDNVQLDNAPLIEEILALRHEMAQLIGFNNYAELSLATKMAPSCDEVESFLMELAEKSRVQAKADLDELTQFAVERDGIDVLEAWDTGYYSDKLKEARYSISQEVLRPYFPVDRVIEGLFKVAATLFDVQFVAGTADTWHGDALFYNVVRGEETIASFYFDLYAREHKRGGAWMASCRTRLTSPQGEQTPVAYLTCNFTPPVDGKPALLTHDEVTTLFHEFGHGLHHMLTKIDVAAVSGISGVAWDAVELPSQFLENWCWQPESIRLMSGHFETGEPLPDELLANLLAARNFQSGMQMLRQLEFGLFDFRLHRNYQPEAPQDPQVVIEQVRNEVAVVIPPAFNRFQNGFSHIFAGGYAAGYYSYKWAEVLSSDAFSRFEERGIFDATTGREFCESILERGGSEDAMTLFKGFMGREPSIDALLRHSGIGEQAAS